jgi:hypothetical protein
LAKLSVVSLKAFSIPFNFGRTLSLTS